MAVMSFLIQKNTSSPTRHLPSDVARSSQSQGQGVRMNYEMSLVLKRRTTKWTKLELMIAAPQHSNLFLAQFSFLCRGPGG